MSKNTSIIIGKHFDNFINRKELIKELKKGEASGFVQKFDRKKFVGNLHGKYLSNKL